MAAFISMILFGFADSLWKRPVQALGAAKTIFFRNSIVVLGVALFFVITHKKKYITNDAIWASLAIACISYLGLYFFAKANGKGKVSLAVPISGTNTLVTLLISIYSLESKFNFIIGTGIAFSILGLILIKFKILAPKNLDKVYWETGFRYALLAAFFWGVSYAFAYLAVTFTGVALFALILESIILVISFMHLLIAGESIKVEKELFKDVFPFLLLIGILGALGTIFNALALDISSINTVCGVISLAPVISILFGRVYFGEKLTWAQAAGVFCIMIGSFLVAYFRYY